MTKFITSATGIPFKIFSVAFPINKTNVIFPWQLTTVVLVAMGIMSLPWNTLQCITAKI